MSVYLGEEGGLVIKRTAEGEGLLQSVLDSGDVNIDRRRFSFDFPAEALITGDRIEIYTVDGSNLELVKGHSYPDGRWFCHIDDTGGVRLYDDFDQSINGGIQNAIELVEPTAPQTILARTRNSRFRCYGQMRSWQLTTSRAAVDTTTLGEEFISQFSRGLISGQGQATCIWDYKRGKCETDDLSEEPHYLCELLLRLKQGALFRGQFFLYKGNPSVWYEADCVVTNVGLSFAPGEVVNSQVEFVTSGPIDLHTGQPDAFITQENTDLLLQESNEGIYVEDNS